MPSYVAGGRAGRALLQRCDRDLRCRSEAGLLCLAQRGAHVRVARGDLIAGVFRGRFRSRRGRCRRQGRRRRRGGARTPARAKSRLRRRRARRGAPSEGQSRPRIAQTVPDSGRTARRAAENPADKHLRIDTERTPQRGCAKGGGSTQCSIRLLIMLNSPANNYIFVACYGYRGAIEGP